MHNPPPSQKPELPIWVWALIGSGGALLLFLAGYGIWNLTTSKSPDSSVASVGQKSEDTNPLFLITKNEKHGFIDRNGNTVIPPQFDNIGGFPAKNNGLDMSIFPEELMAVSIGGKWGYIDETGKIVIQPQFDVALNFSDGMAWVQTQNAQGGSPLQGFIDKSGKLVIQLENTQKQDFFTYFQEGFAPIIDGNSISYIDKSVKTIFKKKFDYKNDYQSNNRGLRELQRFVIGDYHFNEGFACGRINDKYGCIDYSGKIVVPAQYDYLGRFSEGLVTVMAEETTKDGN